MRAHIHFDRQGWPQSINNYLALDGFQQMGWEIVPYTDAAPVRNAAPDEIVVGHIAAVRAGLRALGRCPPNWATPRCYTHFWAVGCGRALSIPWRRAPKAGPFL